jgi:outer membrane protein assembly factor BamB
MRTRFPRLPVIAGGLCCVCLPRAAVAEYKPLGLVVASPEPGWPQFRGPRRDGICKEQNLLPSWPEGGPKLLWSVTGLGNGYSSPIISNERIYLTGDVGDELHLFALDLSGKTVWQAKNGAAWKEEYPGARASVTYRARYIYHRNAHGRVACFDSKDGTEVWAVNIAEQFGGKNITWGLSECLPVDGGAVYVTAGGSDALIVALDAQSGRTIWKSKPLSDLEGDQTVEAPSYASPILMTFAGRKVIIGCSLKHLFCADAATGELQWTKRLPTTYSVLAMMPVFFAADRIFMTAPHGAGGRCYQLTARSPGSSIGVMDRWTSELDTCQGGVVSANGKLCGAFYSDRKGWAAVNATNGEILYTNTDIAKGAPLFADGKIYALAEDGWMYLLEPTEKEFAIRGRFRLADAAPRDAWAHPVIHEGRLYLRYHDRLMCYDVRGSN